MKKFFSILLLSLAFFSCNPEGTELPPEPGSIIGTYKISYILKTISPVSGSSYNEILNNSDPCIAQTSLTINSEYQFIIKNFQLINNNCKETEIDHGTLSSGKSFYGNPFGNMEFSNDSNKNSEYYASSANSVVKSFKFNYTLHNTSPDIRKVWVQYFFKKN